MRRFLLSGLMLALAGLGIVHAGPAPGRVTVICSAAVEWCDVLKAHFPRATGIAFDFVRMSTGEVLVRLRAERANPVFDVWFGGTGDPHFVANEEGLTESFRPRNWDELRPELRDAVAGKYIPLYAGVLGWALSPRLLREKNLPEPRTWRDLAEPHYRGLVAYANPSTSGTGYTMLATMVQVYGEKETFEILKRVHRNVAEYTRAGAAPGVLTGRGEIAIGITFNHDSVMQILRGFPITYGSARDGTGYEIGGISLVKGAPNRANGITFIEWALTPEAQRLAGDLAESYQLPSNSRTPVPRVSPRFQDFNVIKYDFVKFGRSDVRDRLIDRWLKEVFPLPK
ncbi:MAG: ABC transporter substrate-binding protein [Armatimonadetes bacterium]|nr:ABC transporter substrate-binding protein [Armatimonadota bacterium]